MNKSRHGYHRQYNSSKHLEASPIYSFTRIGCLPRFNPLNICPFVRPRDTCQMPSKQCMTPVIRSDSCLLCWAWWRCMVVCGVVVEVWYEIVWYGGGVVMAVHWYKLWMEYWRRIFRQHSPVHNSTRIFIWVVESQSTGTAARYWK